ncbi:uncharacterized protein LOC116423973 [Nomia melanderi]|uniref:uncharacterized protein LOC116423973 n=1 Tax=Nomia melanderi TaxID=2448451 RepID=UPI001304527D|nr:uncharacterized protein LOC116423973 [Nomia melanderi]
MTVEYSCTSSSSTLSDQSSIRENKSKNCHKSCYYICLGTLAHTVHTQIQRRYRKNDDLYLTGSKYVEDIYKWVYRCKYRELLVNDFFKSFIASVVLFALGAKLASELAAWKIS